MRGKIVPIDTAMRDLARYHLLTLSVLTVREIPYPASKGNRLADVHLEGATAPFSRFYGGNPVDVPEPNARMGVECF